MNIGFPGCEHQGELTPFQRQVYEFQQAKQAHEQQQRMEQARNGNGGQTRNSLAGTGSSGNSTVQSETIRYKTEGENSEANTDFID